MWIHTLTILESLAVARASRGRPFSGKPSLQRTEASEKEQQDETKPWFSRLFSYSIFFTTKVECTTQPYVLKQEISHDKWIMFTSYKPVQFYMHDMCIIYILVRSRYALIHTAKQIHTLYGMYVYIYEYIHMCIYCTNQLEHFYTGYPRSAIFGTQPTF